MYPFLHQPDLSICSTEENTLNLISYKTQVFPSLIIIIILKVYYFFLKQCKDGIGS